MAAPDIVYEALLTLTTAPIGTRVGSGSERWGLTARTGTVPGLISVTCARVVGGETATAVLLADGNGNVRVMQLVGPDLSRWRARAGVWFEV